MKWFLYSLAALFVIFVVILVALSVASRKQPELGLVEGQLRPCPETPNCVGSEYRDDDGYVQPLGYTDTAGAAWDRIKDAIESTGGTIISEDPTYLHAIYETPLLRFVDDVEFRLDQDNQVIHVRSASRVGRSDLGANRKRVERIRAAFTTE